MRAGFQGPACHRQLRDIEKVQVPDVIRLDRLQQTEVFVLFIRRKIRVIAPAHDLCAARVIRVRRFHAAVVVIFRDVRDRYVPAELDRLLHLRSR